MVLTEVGTYRRALGGSLERLLENTLDWEHLPWLHSSSFSSIECLDAGRWGWRATVGSIATKSDVGLELLLDADRSTWVNRTTDGLGVVTEIWTTAVATGARSCEVTVTFHAPNVRTETAVKLGRAVKRGLFPLHRSGGRWPRVRYSEILAAIVALQCPAHSVKRSHGYGQRSSAGRI